MAFGEPRARRGGGVRRGARTSNTLWLPITAAAGLLLLLAWFALSKDGGTPDTDISGSARAGAAVGAAAREGAEGGPGVAAVSATPTRAPIPASGCTTGKRIPAGAADQQIAVGGKARAFHLAVPATAGANTKLPLVFNFHGSGQSPGDIEGYTHVSSDGVAKGYAVVTPAGENGRWNFIRKASAGPDDVLFVETVLNDLTSRMCLDDKRVFAVGYSDGADMAIAATCVLTGRFAAVVTVAASTFPGDCTTPPPNVLDIHGSADPVAPFEGGGPARPAPFDGVRAQPVEERLNQVAGRLGCTEPQDWSTITAKTKRRVWMGCRGGGDVGLIVAEGGGHTWLGAKARPDLGPTVSDMSATEVAFLYFVGHVAPAPAPASPSSPSPSSASPSPSQQD